MELTAVVHHEGESGYWAEVVELPGCFASGFTLDELKESLEEAVALYLNDDAAGAAPAPAPRMTAFKLQLTA